MNTTLFTKTLKMLVSFILVLGVFVSYSPSSEAATTKATTYRLSADAYLYDKTASSRKRLLTIKTGTIVSSTYESASFRRVSYNGKTGYVASKYLAAYDKKETIKGQRFLVSKKTPLHTAASATAPVTVTLNEQDAYYTSQKVTNSVGEVWYRVTYGGKMVYARSLNTTPILFTKMSKTDLKTTDGYILRQYAGTAYPRQLVVPTGTSLQTTGRVGDWYSVTYAGKSGYMHKGAFASSSKQELTTIPETAFKTKSALVLYNTTDGTKRPLITIPSGTIVKSTARSGLYHRVTYNGKTGYALTVSLTEYTATTKLASSRFLLSTAVAVKASPLSSSATIASLQAGNVYYTKSLVTNSVGEQWHKISKDGKSGYVKVNQGKAIKYYTVDDLSLKTTTATVIRSYAGSSYGVVKTIPGGTVIKIQGQIGNWYKMLYDGKSGYALSKNFIDNAITQTIPKTDFKLRTDVQIKIAPQATATTVTTFKANDIYQTNQLVTNGSSKWHRVTKDGQTGYVPIDQGTPVSYIPENMTMKTTATTALRTYAGNSYTTVTTITKDTHVQVVGKIDGWYKVSYSGKTGYIASSMLIEFAEKKSIMTARFLLNAPVAVKSDAKDTAKTIATLNKGNVYATKILVDTSANGQWHQVTVNGKTGYIKLGQPTSPISYEPIEKSFVRATGTTSLRSYVGDAYQAVAYAPMNTLLPVTGKIGSWYEVSYEGKTLYAYNATLVMASAKQNVYNSVATPFTFDSFISAQMKLNPPPQTDLYASKLMYVSASYVRLGGALDPVNGTIATVTATTPLNIRSGATTASHVYGQFKPQAMIKVYQNVSGFYTTYPRVYTSTTRYSTIYWLNALEADVRNVADPLQVDRQSPAYYQFLDLSKPTGATAATLNNILTTKGIFGECTTGSCGQAFIDAGNKYNVNEIYLISHALLETGNGSSTLANGVTWNGRKVYNMYGIGAYDYDAVNTGAAYAYSQGWFTPEAAIIGGAEFISTKYIHNEYDQNTLYKMRWSPMRPGVHQYATDMGWAVKQTTRIYNLYQQMESYTAVFDIPVFAR